MDLNTEEYVEYCTESLTVTDCSTVKQETQAR